MQAVIPQLRDMIDTDGTNIVEIYSCPEYFKDISDTYTIDLKWPRPAEFFNIDNPQEEIQYYHRDLCYTFDTNNDAQKSFRRSLKKELFYRNLYITAFQEEVIPSHRFPSTQDISATVKITRYTQKINNRMYWIYEKDETENWTTYIRYQHAPNVEMNKMQQDLERTIHRMPKPTRVPSAKK
jgi:hypothetical protein